VSGYRLRPRAVEDLNEIADFITRDNPARAVSFIEELIAVCEHIGESPRGFPRRDDLAKGLRQAVHGRYLLLFTADEKGVVIERIVHGARRLEDLI
jgi:toxin ParE1/3/4